MVKRKARVSVLLDTNVVARALIHPYVRSTSTQILNLWIQRRIQLDVSLEVVAEYLEIFERLKIERKRIQHFVERLAKRETVTHVNLGRRLRIGRDPDDEIILSTADAAHVDYLVTLDKDLLELEWEERRRLKFEIITPTEFLKRIESE